LTRGDRRRNERIEQLRLVVRPDRTILAIDLGEDKQVAALMDHDGRVLGWRTVTVKAFALGALLGWAAGQAARHGFAAVVVGCEPTGHRWRSVMQLADDAGMGFDDRIPDARPREFPRHRKTPARPAAAAPTRRPGRPSV
jgi:hypothetical protein